uniref:Tripartite motif family-like 2 n=1 Tax=Cricetulus griseus TaxID=10029 RepID=A0A8C2LEB5_CRIGR
MSQMPKPQVLRSTAEEALCGIHLQPLHFFCDDEEITVCRKCVQSPEHMQHEVYGLQEAAEYYRKLLQETLVMLEEKLEAAESLLADEQERMLMIQEEEQRFKEIVQAEYKMRFLLLTEQMELPSLRQPNQLRKLSTELKLKSQKKLQRLSHVGRENMNKLKTNEVCASKFLCSLQETISELERKCGESAVALLQCKGEFLLFQSLKPAHITDLSSCLLIKMKKGLLKLQRNITLDPDTAHPSLVLSEDLRSMRFGDTPQSMPDAPGRFDFRASVLGAESFSSGRHYWEVDVGQATQWQLGICDCTEIAQASGDKFLLMGFMMGTDYTFWVFPPLRKVCLRTQMHKVGVFLDCSCGQVSFYNVTDRSLIYSFCDLTFRGAVKPIFSLCIPYGDMSSDSLTVCLP